MKILLAIVTVSVCLNLALAFDCPLVNVNFNLNDLNHPEFVVYSWEDCGKKGTFTEISKFI